MAVEPASDEIWKKLTQLHQKKSIGFMGGIVERCENRWGFRFKPEDATIVEFIAEGLEATVRYINENMDYWLDSWPYVSAIVAEVHSSQRIPSRAQDKERSVDSCQLSPFILCEGGRMIAASNNKTAASRSKDHDNRDRGNPCNVSLNFFQHGHIAPQIVQLRMPNFAPCLFEEARLTALSANISTGCKENRMKWNLSTPKRAYLILF
jgi:hypothetical protein